MIRSDGFTCLLFICLLQSSPPQFQDFSCGLTSGHTWKVDVPFRCASPPTKLTLNCNCQFGGPNLLARKDPFGALHKLLSMLVFSFRYLYPTFPTLWEALTKPKTSQHRNATSKINSNPKVKMRRAEHKNKQNPYSKRDS